MWRRGRRRCGLPGLLLGCFLAGSVTYDIVNSRHPLTTLTRLVKGPGMSSSSNSAKPWETGEAPEGDARPRRKHIHPDDGPDPPEPREAGETPKQIVFEHKRGLAHPGADVGHLRGGSTDQTVQAEVEVCVKGHTAHAYTRTHAHTQQQASSSTCHHRKHTLASPRLHLLLPSCHARTCRAPA